MGLLFLVAGAAPDAQAGTANDGRVSFLRQSGPGGNPGGPFPHGTRARRMPSGNAPQRLRRPPALAAAGTGERSIADN
ncbi:hypothetical protein MAFF301560_41350 (plasmid) [Ralstonia solanacearum]|nr:hypothetical protein MAFF301560_41350 [Ralstonia solanacearum]BEU48808.1 hypothetical protein MAFF211519_41330 [Ralstonia pseudosolanacearum]